MIRHLAHLPAWAFDAVVALIVGAARIINAANDEERKAALMTAAEQMKEALDRAKFGGR